MEIHNTLHNSINTKSEEHKKAARGKKYTTKPRSVREQVQQSVKLNTKRRRRRNNVRMLTGSQSFIPQFLKDERPKVVEVVRRVWPAIFHYKEQ